MTRNFIALAAAALFSLSAQAANELKIGFLSTLSGPAGGIGIEIRDGFNLALKLAGGKLGGLPTEVVIADDTLNPDNGRQLAERLLKRDRVNLMTGVVFSNVMLAVWPTIHDAKVFYIAPNATPTSITGKGCSPYFFSSSWPNEAHHEAAGEFANSKGFKNVYLIAPNYPAGKDSLTGFKRMYKGKLVDEMYTKLGQLDYAAELSQIRAAKPEALYVFLPGGMGINFIKQFVASGMSRDIQLIVPLWGSDQDIIRAVGEPMLGLFSVGHWSIDFDNPANKKFVAEFEKEYKRLPTGYAATGYDTAMLIDSAIRKVKGRIEDKNALRAALRAADFKSVRGDFKFGKNQFPVQNYYLQLVGKGPDGRIVHKTMGTVLTARGDAYVQDCKMQ